MKSATTFAISALVAVAAAVTLDTTITLGVVMTVELENPCPLRKTASATAAPLTSLASAPVHPAPAAVAATAAPAQSQTGTNVCGSVGGTCSGDATTYDGAVGSCGYDDSDGPMGDNYFALASEMMGPLSNDGPGLPTNPYCNRTAAIRYNGQEYYTVLTDKCEGCKGQSIDLSPRLFAKIFDGATTGRYHIEWFFTSPVVVY